jgi:4a-hydroxytetrahydrobiopterin dehydratase
MEFLDSFLEKYPEWFFVAEDKATDGQEKMVRIYPMADFLSGTDFLNDIASLAEAVKHHPSILLQYDSVTVELWTQDADEVTKKDVNLATQIEEVFSYL